jgi:hypothetical protein
LKTQNIEKSYALASERDHKIHRIVDAKAMGSSGYHLDFIVQTLDNTARDFASGFEPIHKQLLMSMQCPHRFLHGFNIGSSRL